MPLKLLHKVSRTRSVHTYYKLQVLSFQSIPKINWFQLGLSLNSLIGLYSRYDNHHVLELCGGNSNYSGRSFVIACIQRSNSPEKFVNGVNVQGKVKMHKTVHLDLTKRY